MTKTETDDLIETAEVDDPSAVLREADDMVRQAPEAGGELWRALFARGQALAELGRHWEAISDYTAAATGFGRDLERFGANLALALFQRARSLEAILRPDLAASDDAAALAAHPEAFMFCARRQREGRLQ